MQVDRNQMYRVRAISEMCDVSPSSIYREIQAGALAAVRIGSSVRVTGEELAAWWEGCAQASRTPGTRPATDPDAAWVPAVAVAVAR